MKWPKALLIALSLALAFLSTQAGGTLTTEVSEARLSASTNILMTTTIYKRGPETVLTRRVHVDEASGHVVLVLHQIKCKGHVVFMLLRNGPSLSRLDRTYFGCQDVDLWEEDLNYDGLPDIIVLEEHNKNHVLEAFRCDKNLLITPVEDGAFVDQNGVARDYDGIMSIVRGRPDKRD